EDPSFLLIEVSLEVGPARARRHLLHDGEVGLLLELALDDQVSAPRLESERPLDRAVLVVNPEREDEIGFGLPGDLELDVGPRGPPEAPAAPRPLLAGRGLTRPPPPVLLAGRLVPSDQTVGPEVDQVGPVAPSVDPVEVRSLHVDPAQPGDRQLDLLLIDADQ